MSCNEFIGVRIAGPSDEQAIFDLLLKLYQENALLPIDETKVWAQIRGATEGGKNGIFGICGVIDGPAGIEAAIGLVMSQFWYTSAWHLNEIYWFVVPERRQSTHAKRLVEFAKWTAERLGMPLLLGVVTRDRLLPKMRLLNRQAPQVGALYMSGLPDLDTFNQRTIDDVPPDPRRTGEPKTAMVELPS